MAIKNKLYFLCFLFLLFSFEINAQEIPAKRPLIEVFIELQKQYNIQFNFAEDMLEGITIVPPSEDLSLEDVLLYLEVNTLFSFSNQNGIFILVRAKDKAFELQLLSEIILSKYIVKGINKLNNGSYEIDFAQFDILPGPVSYTHLTLPTIYSV